MKILATVITLTLCLLVGSAYAADSTYNWSGIYGGASIGYVHGLEEWKLQGSQFWGGDRTRKHFTFDQFDVGAHVGGQYQWKWLVLGVEGSIFKGPYDEKKERSPVAAFPVDRWRADIYEVAKATGKVGFAYQRFLGYAKGGYAGGVVHTETRFPEPGSKTFENRTSDWHNGWTVGGGVEYAVTNHWIVGAEYNYIDLGSETHTDQSLVRFSAKVNATLHQVLFRLSYKFNLF